MIIALTKMPASIRGIYGPKKDSLPERMRYLHPEAADAFKRADRAIALVVTDMYRSAEASLMAVRAKRGALPPGVSPHGYGLAIDLDITATLRLQRLSSDPEDKADLDTALEDYGWYCHRKDHRRGFEDWHYNYLGGVDQAKWLTACKRTKTTAPAVEARIQSLYGPWLTQDVAGVQTLLSQLGMYSGAIDGKLGPLSQEAIRAFQRAWGLREDGKAGPRTQRTLAFVTAKRTVTQ